MLPDVTQLGSARLGSIRLVSSRRIRSKGARVLVSVVNTSSRETNGRCRAVTSCTTAKGTLSRACCVRAYVRSVYRTHRSLEKLEHLQLARIGSIVRGLARTSCDWGDTVRPSCYPDTFRRRRIRQIVHPEREEEPPVHDEDDEDDNDIAAIGTRYSYGWVSPFR